MTSTAIDPQLLKSKHHFEILDGLRGVAAISVVVFHFMEFIVPDYANSFIAHAYLAVDFFFCLSGFVIAYAYDSRLPQMGAATFYKLRLIRLHPLVVIGAIIGVLAFVFDPFSDIYSKYGIGQTMLMFLSSFFMVPYPLIRERYFNLFHLDPPAWSLFWEYVANLFYGLILFKLVNKTLWVLTIIAALILCYTAYTAGNLSVGWSGGTFFGGGARVFFSFLAGMLVYRSKWVIRSKFGFVTLGILLFITFLVPYRDQWNWLTEPPIVIIVYPLLLAIGAGSQVSAAVKGICKFCGDISYPLYMVHYPFLWIFCSYLEAKKPSMAQIVTIVPVATIALLLFAYLVLRYIDTPIRVYLKNKLK